MRFVTIHCGSYIENQIKLNDGILQLPSEENRESISVTVFVLEVFNLFYVSAVIALDSVALTTENDILTIISLVMLILYLIFVLVLVFLSPVMLDKEVKRISVIKFNELRDKTNENTLSFDAASEYLQQGKKLYFELYGLAFSIEIYKEKHWQLLDLTHGRILMVNKEIDNLLSSISINLKTLCELWPYLEIKVKD